MIAAIKAVLVGTTSKLAAAVRFTVRELRGPKGRIVGYVALISGAIAFGVGIFMLGANEEPQGSAVAEGQFFEIRTGPLTGTYYPLGNTIAAIISNPAGSVRCADEARCGPDGLIAIVQTSAGSIENVEAVHAGTVDSAFAQANVVNRFHRPDGANAASFENLRAISRLYPEVVHLVVLGDSPIETLADLRGKTVSIDRPNSGTNGIALQVLATQGLTRQNTNLLELPVDRATELLASGELDAFFYVAGLPVRAVADLANWSAIRLIPVSGPEIADLVETEPYLTQATISAGTYEGVPEVPSISVPALWVTSRDADFELIYQITRALWNPKNRAMLESGSAQAPNMGIENALSGVPIPFHPGASEYYREMGLFP